MKSFLTLIASLILTCLISGCTEYWYQPGKTFEQCKVDIIDCRDQAMHYYNLPSKWSDFPRRFEVDCMTAKGYKLIIEDKLPLKIKRQDPVPFYSERYGVAGELEADHPLRSTTRRTTYESKRQY